MTHKLPLIHLPRVRYCAWPPPAPGGGNPSATHRMKRRQFKESSVEELSADKE